MLMFNIVNAVSFSVLLICILVLIVYEFTTVFEFVVGSIALAVFIINIVLFNIPYKTITKEEYTVSLIDHRPIIIIDDYTINLSKILEISMSDGDKVVVEKSHGFWAGPLYKGDYYEFYYDDQMIKGVYPSGFISN